MGVVFPPLIKTHHFLKFSGIGINKHAHLSAFPLDHHSEKSAFTIFDQEPEAVFN